MRPDGLITVVKRISTESTLSDDNRLCFLGGILAHHQDPVQARQIPARFGASAAAVQESRGDPGSATGSGGNPLGDRVVPRCDQGGDDGAGLNEIVTLWAKQDPRSTGQWVEDLPDAVEKEKFRAVLKGTPNP